MQVLLIRHAIAEDREEFARRGLDDDDRPLTQFGRQRMARNAKGLRKMAPAITRLGTSPLRRARQTAVIVGEAYGTKDIEVVEAMRPTRPLKELLRWLRDRSGDECVALVGHEPHLGTVATWLLSGVDAPRVTFKKGGAVLMEFGAVIAPGEATLLWALTPSQLRRLAD